MGEFSDNASFSDLKSSGQNSLINNNNVSKQERYPESVRVEQRFNDMNRQD